MRLTVEERVMVRDLILLPHILTMVDRAIRKIEHSGDVLTQVYILSGEYIRNRVIQEIQFLQNELKQRNIKVTEDENNDFLLYYMIYYRGYQERFGMTRDVMRTEISVKLTRYTSDFGSVILGNRMQ